MKGGAEAPASVLGAASACSASRSETNAAGWTISSGDGLRAERHGRRRAAGTVETAVRRHSSDRRAARRHQLRRHDLVLLEAADVHERRRDLVHFGHLAVVARARRDLVRLGHVADRRRIAPAVLEGRKRHCAAEIDGDAERHALVDDRRSEDRGLDDRHELAFAGREIGGHRREDVLVEVAGVERGHGAGGAGRRDRADGRRVADVVERRETEGGRRDRCGRASVGDAGRLGLVIEHHRGDEEGGSCERCSGCGLAAEVCESGHARLLSCFAGKNRTVSS